MQGKKFGIASCDGFFLNMMFLYHRISFVLLDVKLMLKTFLRKNEFF